MSVSPSYICPLCQSRVMVLKTNDDYGSVTEYRCIACRYYHVEEIKYNQGTKSWSSHQSEFGKPNVAPLPEKED